MKMSHKLTEAIQILGPYVINCEKVTVTWTGDITNENRTTRLCLM